MAPVPCMALGSFLEWQVWGVTWKLLEPAGQSLGYFLPGNLQSQPGQPGPAGHMEGTFLC